MTVAKKIFENTKNLGSFLLDFFFPPLCPGCGAEGEVICDDCLKKISHKKSQVCPVCKNKSKHGATCAKCQTKTSLSGLLVAADYSQNLVIEKGIEQFKYRFSKRISPYLGDILASNIEKNIEKNKDFLLTFVPLHCKREKWRGFNQSEDLARLVSQKNKFPLENLLQRTKETLPQATLSREERITNTKDAFCALRKGNGENVLIIDDVASTLSTLENCAKELKKNGFEEVWGAVLARN